MRRGPCPAGRAHGRGDRERVLSAPALTVVAVDRRLHDRIPDVMPPMAAMKQALEADPTRREGLGTSGTWMQAGYPVLAARAGGPAAGPMAGFDADGLRWA